MHAASRDYDLAGLAADSDRLSPVVTYDRPLATAAGVEARFVESELYATPDVLPEQFDLVYTGVGALIWLPDVAAWARVVAALLRPGGRLYVRDGHPMLYTLFDGIDDDVLRVSLPYFEGSPQRWDGDETYTDGPPITSPEQYEWNHGIGEITQAVIGAGLQVTALREHAESEWKALSHLVEGDDGKFRLAEMPERLPMMFTLEARK